MRKRIAIFPALVLVLALILSTASYATQKASYYLQYYDAYITKSGNTIKVNFEVQGTSIMDAVGVTEIYLYERENSTSSWILVQTYLSTNPNYTATMIGTNTGLKYGHVSYSGSSTKQYMAYVTCYAEKNGGSDSRDITAN